jgi:hypothetical protein
MNNKEQIYFSHSQIQAIEKAVKEMRINGLVFDTIRIINNGPSVASWIELEPTQTKYLIELGMKAGKHLQ